MATFDIAMPGVPRDVVAADGVRELHHAHAAFHEAPSDEAAFGELAFTVEIKCWFAFLGRIKNIRHSELHAEGHLHRLDAGLQFLILLLALEIKVIELRE